MLPDKGRLKVMSHEEQEQERQEREEARVRAAERRGWRQAWITVIGLGLIAGFLILCAETGGGGIAAAVYFVVGLAFFLWLEQHWK